MVVLSKFVPLFGAYSRLAVLIVGPLGLLRLARLARRGDLGMVDMLDGLSRLGRLRALVGKNLSLLLLRLGSVGGKDGSRGRKRNGGGGTRIMLANVANIGKDTSILRVSSIGSSLDELLLGSRGDVHGGIHGAESSGSGTRGTRGIGYDGLMSSSL